MGNDIKETLARVDFILESVAVSGDNVFRLAEARRLLKTAFDALKADPEHEYRMEKVL